MTEKIRQMLTTPRNKKKQEEPEVAVVEDLQHQATAAVVEEIVENMYKAVDDTILAEQQGGDTQAASDPGDGDKDSTASKPPSTKSSVVKADMSTMFVNVRNGEYTKGHDGSFHHNASLAFSKDLSM